MKGGDTQAENEETAGKGFGQAPEGSKTTRRLPEAGVSSAALYRTKQLWECQSCFRPRFSAYFGGVECVQWENRRGVRRIGSNCGAG